MKAALVVFVKTPGFSPVKTRLAKSMTIDFANEFYNRSLLCTALFLKSLKKEIKNLDLFWAVAEDQGLNSEYWKNFSRVSQGEGDLGMRLNKVYSELIHRYDAIFFMGADSPHLSYKYISEMINSFLDKKKNDFMIGNTSDGGYYFFGGKKYLSKSVWLDVRYSSIHTSLDFVTNLKPYGSLFYLNDSFDIDEKNDLSNYTSDDFSTDGLIKAQLDLISWIQNYLSTVNHKASSS